MTRFSTLRPLHLLDATESYHREVAKNSEGADEAVKELLPRLRDPDFTRILLIALPEATPVHEAERLQEDLCAVPGSCLSPGSSTRARPVRDR